MHPIYDVSTGKLDRFDAFIQLEILELIKDKNFLISLFIHDLLLALVDYYISTYYFLLLSDVLYYQMGIQIRLFFDKE